MKKKEKGKKTKVKKVVKRDVVSDKPNFKIRPLGDRVLIKPFDPEEANKTVSGIIIPDIVSKEKPEQGTVIAVGDGRFDDGVKIPVSVKVGDKVVFSRYGYEEIKYDGVEYYVIKEENILAIIK